MILTKQLFMNHSISIQYSLFGNTQLFVFKSVDSSEHIDHPQVHTAFLSLTCLLQPNLILIANPVI